SFFSSSSLLLLFFFSPSSLLLLSCFSPSSLLLLSFFSPYFHPLSSHFFLTRVAHPPPNSNFKKASAAFSNSLPYRYHQGFSTSFSQSTSTYFTFTISSNPAFPCVRPHPLNPLPPCGASAIANPLITSFTSTVPAFSRRANPFPRSASKVHTLAASANSVSFARATASSASFTTSIAMIGPNVSS